MVTPVRSWADDYDIFAAEYVSDPFPIWDELRGSCPIAHSERYGGSWLPTRYEDVAAIAHDVAHFSSRNVSVVVPQTDEIDDDRPNPVPDGLPPITGD